VGTADNSRREQTVEGHYHHPAVERMLHERARKKRWPRERVLKYVAFFSMLLIGSGLTLLIAWSLVFGKQQYVLPTGIVWGIWFSTLLYVKW
jgi:hypothetical protein